MQKYTLFLFCLLFCYASNVKAQNLNLKIIGAADAETEVINSLNYNTNHVDINSIIIEADSLQHRLTKIGYFENERSLLKKTNDSSYNILFKLNTKYKTIKINYDASKIDKSIIDKVTKESFKDYFILKIENIEKALQYINLKIANNGYPFSKIKLSEIKTTNKESVIAQLIIVKEEEKRGLDNIIIKGYEKFSKSYLKRFLKIKPEKTFNIESIRDKMTALNNLQFAEQTKAPEILFTKDSTTLYLYLKKSQSNTFDGFLGFSTNENTNRIDFNGYLNLDLKNNFNYGETFNLIYISDESEQKNFEVNLSLPYLFSTPLGTALSLKILKQDSTFTTVNQKADVFYQINSKNRVYLGIESSESNNLLNEEINTSVADYKSNLYNLKYTFEKRFNANKMFLHKSKAHIEFGIGQRKLVANNENQKKIRVDAFNVFQINQKNSFYARFTGALLNSNTYLENELFRFGGINSIRGFQENSIYANNYAVINTEYRYKLSNSIYAHSIIDVSNFENKLTDTKENLYGFGFGFGIATKAGLLKFNFANGKSETQNFIFSNSKIHISLVSIF